MLTAENPREEKYMAAKEEQNVYDIETIRIDDLEPTPEMKELLEKEKRGEITREEIRKIFDRGYRMKKQKTAGYLRTYAAGLLLRQAEGDAI